jgi:hypothetical protein
VVPALALALLSPLIAEYLLGDFSVRQIGLLLVLGPQYGCGALLIRELARRFGRGWPSMLWLALAYALVEEGLTTQSLFNPHYAGQRLLDYGYIPALGTSLNWTLFVLTLHVVWSIGSAIALAEALAGRRWKTPWLGTRGLVIVAVLFVLGCAFTTVSTRYVYPFAASARQFAASAALAVAAAWGAVALPVPPKAVDREPPPEILIAASTFLLASAFQIVHTVSSARGWPAAAALAVMAALAAAALVGVLAWSRRCAWGPAQSLAAATGAILTYCWLGLWHMAVRGATALGTKTTAVDVAGQAVLITLDLGLIAFGAKRLKDMPARQTVP